VTLNHALDHLDVLRRLYYEAVGHDPEREIVGSEDVQTFIHTVGRFNAHVDAVECALRQASEAVTEHIADAPPGEGCHDPKLEALLSAR
jgi:hypothetical protein